MKILVTGGAGFIGANFIFYMLNKYPAYKILCIDKLTYAGNKESLAPVTGEKNFSFFREDICDRQKMDEIFARERPDVVINFAAESHVDNSIKNPGIFLQTNILGTASLLDASLKYKVGRFHQISTDEVYGDLPLNIGKLMFTEKTPLKASSPYSASKASADLLVMAYHRTYGLPVSISRCSNNYGPYQFPEKLIPLMTINAMNDKPLPVYGEGKNVRDWIYVTDHIRAIDLIIHNGDADIYDDAGNFLYTGKHYDTVGEIYNVGAHGEADNLSIVRQICALMGKSGELITFVEDRKGHDLRYAIDPAKIRKELMFAPTVSFEEGIRRTVEWYKKNTQWWKPLAERKTN